MIEDRIFYLGVAFSDSKNICCNALIWIAFGTMNSFLMFISIKLQITLHRTAFQQETKLNLVYFPTGKISHNMCVN